MKKAILFLILVLSLSSFGYATTENYYLNPVFYLPFNSSFVDSINAQSPSTSTCTDSSFGRVGNSIFCNQISNQRVVYSNQAYNELNGGTNDYFTLNLWINSSDDGTGGIISKYDEETGEEWWLGTTGASGTQTRWLGSNTPTPLDDSLTKNQWVMITIIYNGTVNKLVNGVRVSSTSSSPPTATGEPLYIGALELNPSAYDYHGYIDEIALWHIELENDNIEILYNSSFGCSLDTCNKTGVLDTSSPTITNIVQFPSNLTVFNLEENGFQVNATITDASGVDKAVLNLSANDIEIYVNGTKSGNITYDPYFNSGDLYKWNLSDGALLSGSYNLNPEYVKEQDHSNFTLQGQNNWVKLRFFNVNSTRNQSFVEYYVQNFTTAVSLSTYYYCNVSYTSGNPVTSNYCTLFAQDENDAIFDNIHGKSKHKVVGLGIDSNGEINGIGVTPTSYILKRGTTNGESIFYVNRVSRPDTVQTSGSSGTSWTNEAFTIDAYITQLNNNETISYRVCANDTLGNSGCSGVTNDRLELENLPPTNVNILNPLEDNTYNLSINISHTLSTSLTGQTITKYDYYYKKEDSSLFTLIGTNSHPINTLVWDISDLSNGDYSLRVTVTDSLNQTSTTQIDNIIISNPLTLTETLLTDIQNDLDNLDEAVIMIGVLLIVGLFVIVGVWTRLFILWTVSGGFMFIAYLYQAYNFSIDGLGYQKGLMWTYLIISIALMLMGVLLQIFISMMGKKGIEKRDIYNIGY